VCSGLPRRNNVITRACGNPWWPTKEGSAGLKRGPGAPMGFALGASIGDGSGNHLRHQHKADVV
jgi:hypothetical protein